MDTSPTISLCMMVKDEERMLPRCLSSIRDYVDEIIVVDTGSTDGTVEIAESFGARIYHHPWEDNFSLHRNQSIGYARGDWFLILDADEEVVEGGGPILREAARTSRDDSVSFQIVSLYAGSRRSVHIQERLFRNHKGIHYEGRIHNRIKGVGATCFFPAKILHKGYNVPYEKAKEKHERRLRILQKEINDDPGNPTLRHYLSASLLSVPDYEKAAAESLKALTLARDAGADHQPLYAWTTYIAATALCHLDRMEEARELCNRGLEQYPEDLDLHFVACQIAFRGGDSEGLKHHGADYLATHGKLMKNPAGLGMAHCISSSQSWRIRWFEAMSALREKDQDLFREKLEKALETADRPAEVFLETGRWFMQKNDLKSARRAIDRALEAEPRCEEAILAKIEVFIRIGDETGEVHWWQELLRRCPHTRDRMMGQAGEALSAGKRALAHKFLRALQGVYPEDEGVLRLSARYGRIEADRHQEGRSLQKLLGAGNASLEEQTSLCFLYQTTNRLEEARELAETILAAEPGRASAHLALAAANAKSGELLPCVSALDRTLGLIGLDAAVEIHSLEELGALFALCGETFLSARNPVAARCAFETALFLNQATPEVLRGMAEATRDAGYYRESLDWHKALLRVSPDPSPVLRGLGEIYSLLGERIPADFCCQRAEA